MGRSGCKFVGDCTAKPRGRCFRCAPRTDDERKRQAEAVKANWQDPEFRKRNAEAVKANWQDPEFRKRQAEATKAAKAGCKGVRVPAWVPADLVDEYLEAAAWQGEEFAASHCRRLKREMAAHA
jgi:hypothetical protein